MELATVDKHNFILELKKLPKKTFEIKAVVPWQTILDNKNHALKHLAETTEIKGFRKGNAPAELVEKSIKPSVLFEATLDRLLPDLYQQCIRQFDLKPIVDPKIRAITTEEGKDWEFIITVCEIPEIDLGEYQKGLKNLLPAKTIWTPGQTQPDKKEPTPDELRSQKTNDALKWLLDNAKVELSDLLIENERARKLSHFLDSIQKLGLSLDQYLANTGKTSDQLVADYNAEAERELKIELILQKLADVQNITVEPTEVDKAISQAKSVEEKSALEKQRYVLSSLIRRQKTLDYLANL